MSLSSGKASGKTITLTAYLDWFEDATGINDSDPKEWHELRERIAELEADLEAFRGKPSGKGQLYDLCTEYRERMLKAEAELAALRKAEKAWHSDEEQLREGLESEVSDWKFEVQKWSAATDHYKARAEKAEAEVERLTAERDWWHNAGCSPDYHHPTHHPPGPKEPHGEGMLGDMCRAQHSAFERAMRRVNPSGDTLGRKERDHAD